MTDAPQVAGDGVGPDAHPGRRPIQRAANKSASAASNASPTCPSRRWLSARQSENGRVGTDVSGAYPNQPDRGDFARQASISAGPHEPWGRIGSAASKLVGGPLLSESGTEVRNTDAETAVYRTRAETVKGTSA